MGLIFKIAVGVIIGLLLFQFIVFQQVDVDVTNRGNYAIDTQNLKNKYIILTDSINSYYRKHKELPQFISDLNCRDRYNNDQRTACATLASNGVFYLNIDNDWISAEPHVLDKQVFTKCKTTKSFTDIGPGYSDCLNLDITSIPEKIMPDFDCRITSDEIERIICSSDRLIDAEVKLSSIYKDMLSKSSDDKKQTVEQDKIDFKQQRSMKCHTSECISAMTTTKISRLEFLGTMNPGVK